ncbi:protein EFR3 homolog cmp44E-like isoform X3 [Daktulosphaira vitifoliae]|uniref:protein EFR3 homolog cmp44E-like isoform X3 n=1 Tax=Daktulosphaira vitifoliae TaxID=58002 RepID=UPI0021AAF796|nr:protein EFR3 homolog cmp44E-like isoform X3 [Daktulosphaira vitifoliae]
MCVGCLSRMRPRYKRLVDNIFPNVPQDGLVKNNMEKLTFYALSSPEKLDRIGEYLFQKASRDISRKRNEFVMIAMEAMDQLLVTCHAQTLNLFVESYLRIVQKLLESSEPNLQILATQSFVRFSNIEEDTPSYHRRYDFFVSKFSSMCHNNNPNLVTMEMIRKAGIKGIQGVIRKTVSDDLVENIWEPVHMDKIVPSLLFNMHTMNAKSDIVTDNLISEEVNDKNDSYSLAESCLRELIGRASFGHVKSVIRPVLKHLDAHHMWVPNAFATQCFRILMFSIQSQYSYAVVETLMTHLDENTNASPKIRTSIADVLSKIIAIAANESVGPTVLEIINSLLTNLRTSVTRRPQSNIGVAESDGENEYREALIHALGEFAAHLPDYQKIEIMMFIMSKVPQFKSSNSPNDLHVQRMCLKSLLMVSTKYSSVQMNATFPQSFLDLLLKTLTASEDDIRLIVLRVLHTLLDRHNNVSKLAKLDVSISKSDLNLEKCSRSDTIFIRKHAQDVYVSIYESLEITNNTIDNFEAVYTTLALICVELLSEESVLDYIRLILSIQELAITNAVLSTQQKFHLHTLVISIMHLTAVVLDLQPLGDYVDKIIGQRKELNATHLLPDLCLHNEVKSSSLLPAGVLIEEPELTEALKASGIEITNETGPVLAHRRSWVENTSISMKGSFTDLSTLDLDSVNSTPSMQRRCPPKEDLSFEAMKRTFLGLDSTAKEEENMRQTQLFHLYRNASFQDLVAISTKAKDEQTLQSTIIEVFNKVEAKNKETPSKNDMSKPIFVTLFPELFDF